MKHRPAALALLPLVSRPATMPAFPFSDFQESMP